VTGGPVVATPRPAPPRRRRSKRAALRRAVRAHSAPIRRSDACQAISRLAALTAAGVSTGDAIASSAKSAARASGNAGGGIVGQLYKAVHRGTALSAAMAAAGMPFTEAEIAVVRAGERGGSTPHALALLAERMERDAGGRRRIASALAYPCILFAGALGALCFLSLVVLPSFTTLYSGHELPLATRTLLTFGDVIRAWGAPAFLALMIAAAAFVAARRRSAAFARVCDRVAVDAPLFRSLALPRAAHETCALLAVLLDAGCEAEEALILASRAAANRVVATRIGDALRALRHGVPLSVAWCGASLDAGGDASPLLEIAEATGSYGEAFRRLAVLEGAAAERALASVCRLAEPIAVVVMAIAVGGGVLAVYQPMLGSASLLLGGTP